MIRPYRATFGTFPISLTQNIRNGYTTPASAANATQKNGTTATQKNATQKNGTNANLSLNGTTNASEATQPIIFSAEIEADRARRPRRGVFPLGPFARCFLVTFDNIAIFGLFLPYDLSLSAGKACKST